MQWFHSSKSLLVLVAAGLVALAALGTAGAAVLSVERVSVSSQEVPGNVISDQPAVSENGRFIAFQSNANNLVPDDTNNSTDIFIRDRQSGTTERVSVSSAEAQADDVSQKPTISADGRFVAFSSRSKNLVADDTNLLTDVFVRDRQLGTTQRVSLRSDGTQVPQGFGGAGPAAISGNGLFVVMQNDADLIGPDFDTEADGGVYVRDLVAGTTERVAFKANGGDARSGNDCAISHDGRFVAFDSFEIGIVPGDTNNRLDIFVRDRQEDTTEWVSAGTGATPGPGTATKPRISPDGRFVCFESDRSDLIEGGTVNWQIFLRDRQTQETERVSVSTTGEQGNDFSGNLSDVSANGRFVVFASEATNLVAGDTNNASDVFLRDRQRNSTECISLKEDGTQSSGFKRTPSISEDGRIVAFLSASDLLGKPVNVGQIFAVELSDEPVNRPPTANAGADRTVKSKAAKAKVVLDGSASADPDKDTLTFTWREGKTQLATGVKPTVKLKKGVHTITLEVRDPAGLTDTDEVVVTVKKKR